MIASAKTPRNPAQTRQKLVSATRKLILHQGFSATGVDEICAEAGVTKGAFFHHFKTKEDVGQAALADWASFGMALYAEAKNAPAAGPLARVHRFFDIMLGFVAAAAPVTCVVGILAQEMAVANPALRETCSNALGDWTDFARELLDEAKAAQPPRTDFDSEDVAWFLNSLWQGSMLVAKTRQDPQIVIRNLNRARAHIDALFFGENTQPA